MIDLSKLVDLATLTLGKFRIWLEGSAPAGPAGLAIDISPGCPVGLGIENPDPAPARPNGLQIEET